MRNHISRGVGGRARVGPPQPGFLALFYMVGEKGRTLGVGDQTQPELGVAHCAATVASFNSRTPIPAQTSRLRVVNIQAASGCNSTSVLACHNRRTPEILVLQKLKWSSPVVINYYDRNVRRRTSHPEIIDIVDRQLHGDSAVAGVWRLRCAVAQC